MRRPIILIVSVCIVGFSLVCHADDPFNASRGSGTTQISGSQSNPFNNGRAGNFNDYRVSLNAEYARQIKEQKWRDHCMNQGLRPSDRDIKPVSPILWQNNDKEGRDDRQVVIEEVVSPIKGGNAKPIAPVVVPDGNEAANVDVSFFGSSLKVQAPSSKFVLSSVSQNALADGWTRLSQPEYASLVADCIRQKNQLRLCDWAFMVFLQSVAEATSSGRNAVSLMMTYLASQAGYNVRLATTDEGGLDMMYATQHLIFDKPYLSTDGVKYYPYSTNSKSYRLCPSRFKNEMGLSLWIPQLPHVRNAISDTRTVSSKRYPEFSLNSSVNKNLISFYSTYPTSCLSSNPVSRWAMYANTPISDHVRQNLYPQLSRLISGMSPLDAVQRILNWIQTGFVYEYDDKVWGGDRAFFPEESLYYPYCDCEDRSILLTRLVRDLLGLKCLLVYYPGHLAAAISFPADVAGDYIVHAGRRFTIADPTYIGAPVGKTMPNMDNSTAKIILLE